MQMLRLRSGLLVLFVGGALASACGGDDAATSGAGGSASASTSDTSTSSDATSSNTSSSSSGQGGGSASGPVVDGCEIWSSNHPLNRPVNGLSVHPMSDAWVGSMGANTSLHADFGSAQYGYYGIPHNTVDTAQPETAVSVIVYPNESDLGPFHIPANPLVEGPSDSHLLVLHKQADGGCLAEELWQFADAGGQLTASSAAIFDLRDDNFLRTNGFTSADAAGLSIVQLTLKYEEVKVCDIRHAIRFTASQSQSAHIYPARHHAGDNDPTLPPMGARFRLKATFDTSGFFAQARCFLDALKVYGGVVADNGSDWYFQGEPTDGSPANGQPYDGWDDDAWVEAMGDVSGADMEFVETDFEHPGTPDILDTTTAP